MPTRAEAPLDWSNPDSVNVVVKWKTERFELEVDTSRPPAEFQAHLQTLTAIEIWRQKLMLKGKLVMADAHSWAEYDLKPGATLLLMGLSTARSQDGLARPDRKRERCEQCREAVAAVRGAMWAVLTQIVPITFSFFWTVSVPSCLAATCPRSPPPCACLLVLSTPVRPCTDVRHHSHAAKRERQAAGAGGSACAAHAAER